MNVGLGIPCCPPLHPQMEFALSVLDIFIAEVPPRLRLGLSKSTGVDISFRAEQSDVVRSRVNSGESRSSAKTLSHSIQLIVPPGG